MLRRRLGSALLPLVWVALGCSGPSVERNVPAPPIGDTPPPAPVESTAPAPKRALELDGIALGDRLEGVLARSPYDQPCELDALEGQPRQIVIYDPEPCEGTSFPDATLLLLFVRRPPSGRTIETIAWIGGTYFSERSSFPLENGTPKGVLDAALGSPVRSFPLDGEPTVTVWQHRPELHTFTRDGRAVGLVWGPMPAETRSNDWRIIGAQMNHVTYVGRRRIRSCCAALEVLLPSAPSAQLPRWSEAKEACLSMKEAFEPIPALDGFRATFRDVSLPGACRSP